MTGLCLCILIVADKPTACPQRRLKRMAGYFACAAWATNHEGHRKLLSIHLREKQAETVIGGVTKNEKKTQPSQETMMQKSG